MKRTAYVPAIVLLVASLNPGPAAAGIGPDPDSTQVWWDAPAGIPVTLRVVPDGSGAPLTAARGPAGEAVDATIHLQFHDALGYPIVGFPPEDMWLGSIDGGLAVCVLGSIADHATDTQGRTTWTQPLRAGGWSAAGCQVYLNAWELTWPAGLNLRFVSPDIDGSLRVDLTDVAMFAADYFAFGNVLRSDLNGDGVVNLGDLGLMAPAIGRHCP